MSDDNPTCTGCRHARTFHAKDEPHPCRAFACSCSGFVAQVVE